MSEDKLSLAKRELTGKKVKSLREQGLIPSVVFGGKGEPVLTQSPYNETEKVLLSAGYHSPIDLDIDGKKQMALVKVVHVDPVKRTIQNVEFQAISANQVVEATTPIEIVNFEQSDASKAHLTILQVMEEIDVKAKPADLPESIIVDASGLKTVEDGIVVADLQLPKGVELADKELDPESAIANVYDPAQEAAEREAEAEADKAAEEARAAEAEAAAEAAPAAEEKA
ncbi:MAG: 50S ribosomal protein L25 [Candidatus Saccharibacteria bacterium]|nr:50S ribosomal protein L25 [Candidatus Saccharibacteria bacterium]